MADKQSRTGDLLRQQPDLAICPHCGRVFALVPGCVCPHCGYPLIVALARLLAASGSRACAHSPGTADALVASKPPISGLVHA